MNSFLAFFVVLALADARPQYNGLAEGGAGAEGHVQGGQFFIFHKKKFPFSTFFNFAQLGSFISLL
jgi:hypothetical protein